MRVLITGVTGFVGGYLAEALLARGEQVLGMARRPAWLPEWQHLDRAVDLHACDLLDRERLGALLTELQPEQIYHLAGYAHVGRSFQEPYAAWQGNLQATLHLFEAIRSGGSRPRVLLVSSGQVYGDPDSPDQLMDERCPLRPSSPYAVSKAAADLAGYQYARSWGLPIVRVRAFNHIGPKQSSQYAVASFAEQIASIAAGSRPPRMQTGDLSPRRDLTDVRDMVRAYLLLMEKGQPGDVYNAGSGVAPSMQEVLNRLLALAGIHVEVQQQAIEKRAADAGVLRADAGRLRREIGWQPAFSLDESLRDILDYWKRRSSP